MTECTNAMRKENKSKEFLNLVSFKDNDEQQKTNKQTYNIKKYKEKEEETSENTRIVQMSNKQKNTDNAFGLIVTVHLQEVLFEYR